MIFRDENKKALILELQQDESPEKPLFGKITPADLIAELEQGTDLAELVLSEFIFYKSASEGYPVDATTKEHAISLMQKSILAHGEVFGNDPFIQDDDGDLLTPNQVLQQLKDDTEFGLLYAATWLNDQLKEIAYQQNKTQCPVTTPMTREEAKVQMRLDMERNYSSEKQRKLMREFGGRSPLQIMEEVEQDTVLGKVILSEFICHSGNIDDETRAHVVFLMQESLQEQPLGWADQPWVVDDNGNSLTPNQLVQQIQDGTDFGNEYAAEWMLNHLATTIFNSFKSKADLDHDRLAYKTMDISKLN